MSFNKKIISVIVVSLIITVFATISFAEEKIALEYWILASREELAIEEKAIQIFESRYPNIEIKIRHAPGEDYYDMLRTSIAAGSMPDLMRIIVEEYQSFAKGGALLDIKPIVEEKLKSDSEFANFGMILSPNS